MLAPRRPKSTRAGFTLVDVCVALAILAVAMGTLVGSVFWALRLERVNEETAAASQLVRAMLEEINAQPFESVYASYNASVDDDPAPGYDYLADLAVDDPLLVLGKKTGPVLSVQFGGDAGHELREDLVDAEFGMPRDLNGDGDIDDLDHAGDYTMLPMKLRLEWEGATGPRAVEVNTLLRSR